MSSSKSSGPEKKKRRSTKKGAAAKAKAKEDAEKFAAEDNELSDLIKSMFPDYDYYRDGGATIASLNETIRQTRETMQRELQSMRQQMASVTNNPEIGSIVNEVMDRQLGEIQAKLPEEIPDPNRSKLSDEKRAEIQRLVDAGASLSRVDALHLAASHYKQRDLFDLLIDEYGLGIEDPDHTSLSSPPLHVAACVGNCEAIEILLAKGADKKSKNSKGRTALQEVVHEQAQRNVPSFMTEQLRGELNVDKVTTLLR